MTGLGWSGRLDPPWTVRCLCGCRQRPSMQQVGNLAETEGVGGDHVLAKLRDAFEPLCVTWTRGVGGYFRASAWQQFVRALCTAWNTAECSPHLLTGYSYYSLKL